MRYQALKNWFGYRRVLAVVLLVSVLLTTVFFNTDVAVDALIDANGDYYYVPKVTATNFYRYNATAVPAAGGGVSFGLAEINQRGTLNNEAIRLDGMTLSFENFQFSALNGASDGALGIFMRGEQPTGGGAYEDPAVNPIANANGVFRLVLSPTWEQLYASNTGGSSVSIISNPALSAANLAGKSFEIRMTKDSDGANYTVTIDISGGAELSGKIAAAMVETAGTNATGYVTPQFGITGVSAEGDGWTTGGINCTFDYVKAGPIFKPTRGGVTVPSPLNNSPDHWGGACYTITDLDDGRGAFYDFFNSYNPDIRTSVNDKAYSLDGLTFEFSNFNQTAGGTHLGMTLSADSNAAASAAGQLQLIIDDNGSLQYRVGGVTSWATAISSALLTPSKRGGQFLKLQFFKKPDATGDYIVNLWVGNTMLTGTLPASAANAVPSGAYAILSMLDGGVGSINYIGIYNGNIFRTISAIDDIKTVDEDSGGDIFTARTLYDSLSEEDKSYVTNYSVLQAAEAAYGVVMGSRDASLSSISVQGTPISGFSPTVKSYTVSLPHSQDKVTVVPSALYALITSPTITDAPLIVGKNTFTITTKSQDESATDAYIINVYRAVEITTDPEYLIPTNDMRSRGDAGNSWSSIFSVTEFSPDSGLHFEYTNAITNVREGLKTALRLDGLTVGINNFSVTEGSGLGIMLNEQGGDAAEWGRAGNLALIIAPGAGKLTAMTFGKAAIDIIEDDALKAADLNGASFEIRLTANAFGGLDVRMSVSGASETVLTGSIPQSVLSEAENLMDTGYVNIWFTPMNGNTGAGDWGGGSEMSFDFVKTGPIYQPTRAGYVSVPTAALGEGRIQNSVWNVLNITDLPDGRGASYTWSGNGDQAIRDGVNKAFYMDGLTIEWNNPKWYSNQHRFGVTLTNSPAAYYYSGAYLSFFIDADTGSLKAAANAGAVSHVVLTDNSLTMARLTGKPIQMKLLKDIDGSGSYTVYLMVGTKVLSGTLPKSVIDSATDLVNHDAVYGIMSMINGSDTTSVEYMSIFNAPSDSRAKEVEDAIAALGTVSLANGSPIRSVRRLYERLLDEEKVMVPNLSVLESKEQEYLELAASADTAFNLKYMSRSSGLMLSTHGGACTWPTLLSLSDVTGGGLRYNFTGAVQNVREGYSRAVTMDGLTLQFDNFYAVNEAEAIFAVYLGESDGFYGPDWGSGINSTALIVNAHEGTVRLWPGGTALITDANLKYANLQERRFSITLKENTNGSYELTVNVNGQNLTAAIPASTFDSVTYDQTKVYPTVSGWNSGTTFSLDFIGLAIHNDVEDLIALIDKIGLVNPEKEPLIAQAETAYNALSLQKRNFVINYNALVSAKKMLPISSSAMVSAVERLIDDIGSVNLSKAQAIQNAYQAYMRLSQTQKNSVSNRTGLENAVNTFVSQIYPKLYMDSVLYSPENYFLLQFVYQNPWPAFMNSSIRDDGSLRIEWTGAVHNVRSGVEDVMSLDGLRFEIANLTRDTGKDGARLSFQITSDLDTDYRNGHKSLAIVLDTVRGDVRAYPGGAVIMQSEKLKHASVEDKHLVFSFTESAEEIYILEVMGDGFKLASTIPSSTFYNANITRRGSVKVGLTPWVDNDEDVPDDGSVHTFSVDLVSISSGAPFAASEVENIMNEISDLKGADAGRDEDKILAVNEAYLGFMRPLRQFVSNYPVLAQLLAQYNELNYTDAPASEITDDSGNTNNTDENTGAKENTDSVPQTGDGFSVGTVAAMLLTSAAWLFISKKKQESSLISEENTHE